MTSCILAGSLETTPKVKRSLCLMLSVTFKDTQFWYMPEGVRASYPGADKFVCVVEMRWYL
jgi:hypothetical protein